MRQINIKTMKCCAFCTQWYDPTNSAIAPKAPNINLWEYDNSARKKCLQKNIEILASSAACPKYECKVPIKR